MSWFVMFIWVPIHQKQLIELLANKKNKLQNTIKYLQIQ